MEGVISPELARILESRREELNRLYLQRAGPNPRTGPDDFLLSFGSLAGAAVGPILGDARLRESAGSVVRGVFLAALELSGRGRLGAEGGGLENGLAALLSAFPGPVAQDPERFVRSAAAAMEATAGKSEETLSKWLSLMSSCGGAVAGMDDFLGTGLAAAWLSGMPQYRHAALKALSSLPKAAVSQLLGLGKADPGIDPVQAVESLSADPWFDPDSMKIGAAKPKACFTTAGGWRGYGGQFEAPPTLKLADGEVLAVDGRSAFRLFADRWGTFLLVEPDADPMPAGKPPFVDLTLKKDGFKLGEQFFYAGDILRLSRTCYPWSRTDIPTLSSVRVDDTIFFTHNLSFKVFIIGAPAHGHGKDTGKAE